MPGNSPRRLHHLAAMLLAGAAIFATTDTARAQQATSISISVPSGNLSTALNALATQAKLQIVYDAAITRGLRTPGVSGNLPVDAALSQLLSGTGISYHVNGKTVTLARASVTDAAAATDADATNLEPIVVDAGGYYGSGGPSNAIIDKQVIARAQAASIPELIKRIPGVSMTGGVRLQGQSISIRGFSRQSDTRIVLDGAPKNFEKYDQGTIFVEPELLKRVEIDKGATSVRYGNGGFGGTIRMKSKDAKDMLRPGENWGAWGKTAYQTANKEFLESGALYGRSDFGTPITYDGLMSLTWRKGDDMRIGGGERYFYSDSKLASGMAKVGLESEGHEVKASVLYGESNNWGPVAAIRGQLSVDADDIRDEGFYAAARKRLAWRELKDLTTTFEYKYTGDSTLWNPRFMASYSSTGQHATRPQSDEIPRASVGGLWNEATYSDIHLELENTSEFTFNGLEHRLNYGLQYNAHKRDVWMYDVFNKTKPEYNYGYYAPYFMPEGTQDTASAFVRDTIGITDNLTLTPGLRFDYVRSEGVPSAAPLYNNPARGHDYSAVSHSGLTPAVSLSWDATPNIRLFADWAYAMRAPNIDELYSTQSTSTAPATSRGLHIERNNTINLGASFNFDDVLMSGDSASARVAVFNNHVTNPVARRFGGRNLSGMGAVGVPWYWNLPAYYTTGVEIQTHYENDWMFADLGFSMMTGTRHGAVNDIRGPRSYVNDLAPTTANVALGMKLPEQDLSFGWTGNFVKSQEKTPYNQYFGSTYARPESPGYAVHGLFLDWTPQDGIMKDTELHAAIENIFDKKYEPYLSDGITAMPGRNFKISLSRKF
ncbi:hemoglobin/transferrin/lactoferrin receptor protein [Neorhizobium huautlense]|uniref:Hemoglobin/transferrin/lactoferrin receptor protein n=1 Tax=Neorhizobium huautlense TaxID=67774 RepID=A0ABT9PZX1_9HYPH|nr:TonB-dependent receptor [Neorhizobium huautlense]MDP9840025.1 hemoglobin/transferrin/lactoferrin receptor protein [Neorhizobium huautlense]